MNVINMEKPEAFTGLNKESAECYFKALQGGMAFLQNEVIKPFEAALKESTGFDNDNRPDAETETQKDLDGIMFTVTSKPTNKRPSYSEVFENLQRDLTVIEAEYAKGDKKKGVLTIEDQAYISVDFLLEKIDGLQGEVKAAIVEQTIEVDGEVDLPAKVAVPIRDYGSLEAGTGRMYVMAKNLVKEISDETVKPFEAALKEASGYSKENMPEGTERTYQQIDDCLFKVMSVPKSTISYGQIINGLVKGKSAKGNVTKTTGDLIKIQEDVDSPAYEVRTRDGQKYVSMESLKNRVNELTSENTKPSLTQTMSFYLVR